MAATVVAVDQLAKWLALRSLDDHRFVEVFWTLRLHLVRNRGSAFGLGQRFAPLIALAAVGVVVALLRARRHHLGLISAIAMGAVVGGALGNLLDRVFRDGHGFLGGAVIDFVDLQWWPVFNVADVAISLGVIALAFAATRDEAAPDETKVSTS